MLRLKLFWRDVIRSQEKKEIKNHTDLITPLKKTHQTFVFALFFLFVCSMHKNRTHLHITNEIVAVVAFILSLLSLYRDKTNEGENVGTEKQSGIKKIKTSRS